MKDYRFFLLSFFLLRFYDYSAQDVPLLKPSWASFFTGGNIISEFPSDSFMFHSLARKDHPSLHPDLEGFSKSDEFSVNSGVEVAFSAGFKLRKKDRSSFSERGYLRLSAVYSENTFLSDAYHRTRAVRFDTLASQSGTTGPIYLDSIYEYSNRFEFNIKMAGAEASLLYHTDPGKLFGLFGGFSLGQFFSTGNVITSNAVQTSRVMQLSTSGVQSPYPGSNFINYNNNNYQSTSLEAKSAMSTRIGIPVGATLRLAKTKKFWKNIQLFFESRPGIDFTIISGYRSFSRPRVSMGSGLRVLFF